MTKHARIRRRITAWRSTDWRLVNDNRLVKVINAVDALMHSGLFLGAMPFTEQRPPEHVVHQGALSGSANAGDADKSAQRKPHINLAQIIFRGTANNQPTLFGCGHGALLGHINFQFASEIFRRHRPLGLSDFIQGAAGHQLTAVHARARPKIQQIIGGLDSLCSVFDDNDGIPDVAEPLKRGQQAGVVALVQANRWLVEDVDYPDQPRANLRGKPNALSLAATESAAFAVERKVAKANVIQKTQAFLNLFQHFTANLLLQTGQFQSIKKTHGVRNRQPAYLHDG